MFLYIMYLSTPIGDVEVCANDDAIIEVGFVDKRQKEHPNLICKQAIQQLSEYFQFTNCKMNLEL